MMMLGVGWRGVRRCGKGLWDYLIARSDRRREVELAKIKNDGTRQAIRELSGGGGEVWSGGPHEWLVIRLPNRPPLILVHERSAPARCPHE